MLPATLSATLSVTFRLLGVTKNPADLQPGRSVWIMESCAPPGKDPIVVRPNVRSRPGRKTLLSAGPDFLSMVMGWSAASGGGGRSGRGSEERLHRPAEDSLQTCSFTP